MFWDNEWPWCNLVSFYILNSFTYFGVSLLNYFYLDLVKSLILPRAAKSLPHPFKRASRSVVLTSDLVSKPLDWFSLSCTGRVPLVLSLTESDHAQNDDSVYSNPLIRIDLFKFPCYQF